MQVRVLDRKRLKEINPKIGHRGTQSGTRGYALFPCSTQLNMKLQLLLKTKMLKDNTFLAFKHSDVNIYYAYKC